MANTEVVFRCVVIVLLLLFKVRSLNVSNVCIEEERVALLRFKNDLIDTMGCLSSWGVGKDCCNWKGVECDNLTHQVKKLVLHNCSISTKGGELNPSLTRLKNLTQLDLSFNNFNSSLPSWLFNNISTLIELELSSSSMRGPLPKIRKGNLCNLESLDLSYNYELNGDISEMLEVLSFCSNHSLEHLDLTCNQFSGELLHSLGQFSNLRYLDISHNSLTGPIPAPIGNLSKLSRLYLGYNMMNGTIPESIGQLTQLIELNLLQKFWEGTINNNHFHNLSNLKFFSISSKNNSLTLKFPHDWIPHFKLFILEINDCKVGPAFPNWLRNQTGIGDIILQNAGISGEIPKWLYNMVSHLRVLDLSHNKISGYLPKALSISSFQPIINLNFNRLKGSVPLWAGVNSLYLNNNLLSGTIPANIGQEMSHLMALDLSNNHLSGSIPLSINRIQNLSQLDLSNNYLTGEIPLFWTGMQKLLVLDLSNNSLSGVIPTSSICSQLPSLYILDLSNNDLSANLSSFFQNCTILKFVVLNNNKFFGSIPKEINKNLPSLSELQLRSNTLTGNIPKELCFVPCLHLLDVAENSLSGTIPACLGDMQEGFKYAAYNYKSGNYSMTYPGSPSYSKHLELVLKGRTYRYFNQMVVQSTIDLSKNNLSGAIPENLTQLFHLGALNLSWNQLTGTIPNSIGSLTALESLDLSHNHLSGPIPPSITTLTFLSYLNLSYNNLSGQIPVANQFLTFTDDPSIYEGNSELCGKPLPTTCSSSSSSPPPGNGEQKREDADKIERLCLYASIALGFITGFWSVCGSLILNRAWRHAYFGFVYDIWDKLLVFIALNFARAKRRFGQDRN